MAVVLVVDDSDDIVELMVEFLGLEGHEVMAASGGREGLTLAATRKPDVVLLDGMMPEMDGLEFLERAQALFPGAAPPIIVTSGYSGYGPLALQRGACAFLPKPFELDALVAVVKDALRGAGPPAEAVALHAEQARAARERDVEARKAIVDETHFLSADVHDALASVVGWLREYFGFGIAWIVMGQDRGLTVGAIHGSPSFAAGSPLEPRENFCWDMIAARGPLVLTDSYANEAFAGRVDAQKQARFYAGVPIRTVTGLALGTLCLSDSTPHPFFSDDIEILEHLAARIARYLEAQAASPPAALSLFETENVLDRATLDAVLGAALRRCAREGGDVEVAMVELRDGDLGTIERCARAVIDAAPRVRSAIGLSSPSTMVLVRYAPDRAQAVLGMDASVAASRAGGLVTDVRRTSYGRDAQTSSPTLGTDALARLAREPARTP